MAINPYTGEEEDDDAIAREMAIQRGYVSPVAIPATTPAAPPAPAVPSPAAQVPVEGVPEMLAPRAPEVPAAIARPEPVTPPAPPAGPILAGRQVTSQSANPEVIKASKQLDSVAADAMKTAGAAKTLGSNEAGAVQGLYASKQAERERIDREAAEKKAAIQSNIEKGTAYLEKVSKDHENYKITDWIDDQTDAVKLQTSVAAGFGAFGSALRGGENQALRIIEGVMARDRQRKLGEVEKKLGIKKDAKEALDQDKARLTLADSELRAQHDALYRNLEHERAAVLSKFGADRAAIDNDKLILGIREKAALNKAEMFKGLETTVTNQYAAPASAAAGIAGINPENIVNGPGGKPLFAAPNKEIAKSGNDIATAYRTIASEGAKLDGLIAKGRAWPGGDRSTTMASIQKNMLLGLKNLEKAGALDNGMVEIASQMIPKDAGVMGNNRAALTAFRDFLRTKVAASFDGMGAPGLDVLRVLDTSPEMQGSTKQPLSEREKALLRQEFQKTKDPGRRASISRALKADLEQ